MEIKPTREVASIYINTRGVGEKRHELVARYSQLEGEIENGGELATLEGLTGKACTPVYKHVKAVCKGAAVYEYMNEGEFS